MGMTFKFTDNTNDVLNAMQAVKSLMLEDMGRTAEGHAKVELGKTPKRIDTGNLRNSIAHQVDMTEDSVSVGTNVEYGIYVHEGTRKMTPNRFLRNSIMMYADQYKRIIMRHLKNG